MEIIEKIRKKIEGLNDLNKQIAKEQGSTDFIKGITAGYAEVLCLLDSLQEETPTDLEEEIEKECYDHPQKDLEGAAEKYAFENFECEDYHNGDYFDPIGFAEESFIAGAEWQKRQMLKDAVEGYVNYYEDSGGILMAEAQVGCPYHNGDKVRIVVLKAEEE